MTYQDFLRWELGIPSKIRFSGATDKFDPALPDNVTTIVLFHPRVIKDEVGGVAEFSDEILEVSFDLRTGNFNIIAQAPKGKRRRLVFQMEHSGRVVVFVHGPWVRHLQDVVLTKAKKYEKGEHC